MTKKPMRISDISNVALLACKWTPFTLQKDSFYRSKGLLLQCKRTPFENALHNYLKTRILQIENINKSTIK